MRRPTGFTLLEVMVVIIIIGVLVTITTISVGVFGKDREVEDEARRFAAVLMQAREEAELQGREIGVMVNRSGYEFFMFDAKRQTWRSVEEDDFYKARELPEGLSVRLWLEGREVVLQKQTGRDERPADEKKAKEETESEGLGIVNKGPVPQITLLSSGEINSFELRLEREGTDHIWRAQSKTDNTIETEEFSDAPAP